MPTRNSLPLAAMLAAGLSACTQHGGTLTGAPEQVGALVSRGYDCGLTPNRQRIAQRYRGDERARFVAASQMAAVRSYNRPVACHGWEREAVSSALWSAQR